MWDYVAVFGAVNTAEMLDARPGRIVRVDRPDALQRLPRREQAKDCEGCGAPLKTYIHHCEYCRRGK